MTPILARWSLGLALFVLAAVDGLWPVLRHYARTGHSGVTVHRADPAERVVGAALVLGILTLAAWALALGLLGPEALGVPDVPGPVRAAGYALIAAGVALVSAAQAQMGRSWRVGIDLGPTELVTHGLYRFVRNPIYSGMLLALAGMVVVSPSPFSALLFAQLTLWIALQVRLEEAHLMRAHGDAYARWAAQVGRFLPGVGKRQCAPAIAA